MSIKEELLEKFNSGEFNFKSKTQICNSLSIFDSFSMGEIDRILNELVDAGKLVKTPKKKYVLSSTLGYVEGVLSGTQQGYAFLIADDKEQNDIFIARKNLHGALHKDRVLVKKSTRSSGNSEEGEVVKVLERGITEIVGTFYKNENYGFVLPDNLSFSNDIFVENKNSLNAKDRQKVVVKITKYPEDKKNPEGKITEIIGDLNEVKIEIKSLMKAYGLDDVFPDKVVEFVKNIPDSVSENECKGREDYTHLNTITIDGDDARDFDDAISIEETSDGYRLYVHIADVSNYVRLNNPLDVEAFKRGTSVYFPSMVIPMLPKELSNGICSLNEGVNRLTMSVVLELDSSAKIKSYMIKESVIRSNHRMTYNEVNKIFDGDKELIEKYSDVYDDLCLMHKLYKVLDAKRKQRGSIDFEIKESKIIVDELDNVVALEPYPRQDSNKLIEEFMILANRVVAEYIFFLELPFVYRVHEKPSDEKLQAFKVFLKGFNIPFKTTETVHPKIFADILDNVNDSTIYNIINKVMLRSMQKAKYDRTDIGHFGLALEHYCHFTSPIRRYADLIVHRILKLVINGKFDNSMLNYYNAVIDDINENCSKKSRNADEAEREADDYYKAKYMLDKIGMSYDGIISGVTTFGVFVELENTVEGMIRFENLEKDDYTYNPEKYTLQGKRFRYSLGEPIKIKVKYVNLVTRKIEFEIDKETKWK